MLRGKQLQTPLQLLTPLLLSYLMVLLTCFDGDSPPVSWLPPLYQRRPWIQYGGFNQWIETKGTEEGYTGGWEKTIVMIGESKK